MLAMYLLLSCLLFTSVGSFSASTSRTLKLRPASCYRANRYLFQNEDRSEVEIEEEARIKILESRRYQIRSVLKSAEGMRNLRRANGWVPQLDDEGKPIRSDGKAAVTLTAFCVAAGAIALRIGGRAALISAVGLDFATDNPELQDNLEQVLTTADSMDPIAKSLLFTLGWTAVKVFCFDAGGVVLALASGILFGGVLQGAVISAAAATIGSSIAFAMAKVDSPVRKKALEVLEEYPSLRGIEKVVARDGLKAVLTLRLAPILPIPIGMYNYIYGVTNVPWLDFAGGIFLGSLKPYLLDSYLGYFGMSVIEGTADGTGWQDMLLLAALGFSVLIGVFASQLAGETWDSVLAEAAAEQESKLDEGERPNDGLTRQILGFQLPQWMIDFQTNYKQAETAVNDMVAAEYEAKVWNFTEPDGGPPAHRDPALRPGSPEIEQANKGFDFSEAFFVGLALSPVLFQSFTKLSDPLFDDAANDFPEQRTSTTSQAASKLQKLLSELETMRSTVQARLEVLDARLGSAEAGASSSAVDS